MTEQEVADKLWQWLTDTLGITVIYAYQGANEPAEPFAVINLMMSAPVYEHRTSTEYTTAEVGADEVVSEAPVRDWFWRFSVNVYGTDAMSQIRKVKTAAEIRTSKGRILPLSIFETGRIADAAEMLNEEWRGRAQMDIELRGVVRDALPIDVAETVDLRINP